MITIFQAALELQSFCDRQAWPFCFIGGIAVQRWSQARVTRDIDITLLTGFGHESPFIETLLAQYAPRSPGAAQFALRSRVLLLNSPSGIGIAEGIAVRHHTTLDWTYVEEQLTPLAEAKEEPAILRELARLRQLSATL